MNWKTLLLGVVGFYLLGFVPFIGWLIQFAFMLFALGSLVRMKLEIVRQWR